MSWDKLGSAITHTFTTNKADGTKFDATGTPIGTVLKNGVVDALSVTVANVSTGLYRFTFTPTVAAGFAAGDEIDLVITATVDGIAAQSSVYVSTLTTKDIDDKVVVSSVDAAAVTAIQAGLATLAGQSTTHAGIVTAIAEILLVKAKTDNLPLHPAASGDAMDLITDALDADALATSAVNEIVDALKAAISIISLAQGSFAIVFGEDADSLQSKVMYYVRGDTTPRVVYVIDSAGDPFDLTGCKVYFTVKENYYDLDSAAIVQKDSADISEIEIVDAAAGVIHIKFLTTDTETLDTGEHHDYIYDIQIKDSSGIIQTNVRGAYRLYGDVTRKDT